MKKTYTNVEETTKQLQINNQETRYLYIKRKTFWISPFAPCSPAPIN
jgi:hypothetical protein